MAALDAQPDHIGAHISYGAMLAKNVSWNSFLKVLFYLMNATKLNYLEIVIPYKLEIFKLDYCGLQILSKYSLLINSPILFLFISILECYYIAAVINTSKNRIVE